MQLCANFSLIFITTRKYVGIEQNFVTFVTNMLDFVKDTAMKLGAMASKIVPWVLQGRKYHHLCLQNRHATQSYEQGIIICVIFVSNIILQCV